MSLVAAAAYPTTFVEVRGGPLATLDRGEGDPVVFAPGYTGSKEDFAPLLPRLPGMRTVAYDQRGQFESRGPDDPAAYTVDALAADLVELAGAVGAPVHVVGHSFGGLVARAAAIAAPESFRSVTLMSTGPAAISGPRVERYRAVERIVDELGMAAAFDALVGIDPRLRTVPQLLAFLRRRWLATSELSLRVMGEELLAARDRTAELRATGLPVLVTHGAGDDAWPPAEQRDMAERLGAAYEVVAGAAHSPAAERPAATADVLLRFWRGL